MIVLFDLGDGFAWCKPIFHPEIFTRFTDQTTLNKYLRDRILQKHQTTYLFISNQQASIIDTFQVNFNGFSKYIYCPDENSVNEFETQNGVRGDHKIITINELETSLHSKAVELYFSLMHRSTNDSTTQKTYAQRYNYHINCLELSSRQFLDDPPGSQPTA